MKTLIDFLLSEQGLTLAALIASSAYAWVKSTQWWQERQYGILGKVDVIIKAAVHDTYESYVRTRKAMTPDGKLTDSDRAEARRLAAELAVAKGKILGVDIAKAIGPDLIEAAVSQAVNRLKPGAVTPLPVRAMFP